MLGLCWTRSGVQIKPLLGLAVADTANPYRLASSQRLQDGGSDVLGNRQRDAVGALNVVAVPQAQHPREAALIADEEPSGTGLEQSLPGIRRLDHAGEELGVEAYDLPGESRRRGASRGLLTRARRRDRSARSEKMRRADAPRVLGLRIALRNHDRRGAEPAPTPVRENDGEERKRGEHAAAGDDSGPPRRRGSFGGRV